MLELGAGAATELGSELEPVVRGSTIKQTEEAGGHTGGEPLAERADREVYDRTRTLPDGMYGAVSVGSSEMTSQTLAHARELAERTRGTFPRAEVVVSPGAPADSLVSGAGPGGYLVILDGPFLPVPDSDGEAVAWHCTIQESLEARAQHADLPPVSFMRLNFSQLPD